MNTTLDLGVDDLEDIDTPADDPVRDFAAGVAVGVALVALFVAAT